MRLVSDGEGPPQKAAMSAVRMPEEIMKVWTLSELFRLTRAELFGLHRAISSEIAGVPAESPEREVALDNLRRIAKALSLANIAPG
jgi:hypothetical protein